VLSTDDPVRVYQQFATLDALSNGRAEITAGRGSSTESFPLFGFSLDDYDELYAEKLDLLLKINAAETVTWNGKFRPALEDALVVPRPDSGALRIWLGTGGNPESSVRAGLLGLPITYAIIGGEAARFAPLADLYRRAAQHAQVPAENILVSIASPGFVGDEPRAAKDLWYRHWYDIIAAVGPSRGFAPPSRAHFDREANGRGALFVGSPEEIAERIVALQRSVGHMRQFFQMDIGSLPHSLFLRGIELLGTRVKPLVDAELGTIPSATTHTSDGRADTTLTADQAMSVATV
jgi:alkanesulfonate monooxygenase SsuD/methylene tetrahydromethanopterin reductase-like flavin-dependent oxidoreductase (luciferase family)